MKNLPKVTNENYFSPECNWAYMSHSQYLAFQRCEAAALAELKGIYTRKSTTALLIGSYVDAYFSNELDIFTDEHPEVFKKDGSLKAEYARANEVIERMEQDDLYMMLMSGRHQVVKTGEIAGVPFKIKIDSLLDSKQCEAIARKYPQTIEALGMCDGAIVDQKVMRDTAPVWSEELHEKLPFAEAWGYDVEGAIYQAIEGHMLPFILAVGTKEESPELSALYIPDNDLAAKLAEIEDTVPRYQAIKEGRIKPNRCGRCPYCRATAKLEGILNYREAE